MDIVHSTTQLDNMNESLSNSDVSNRYRSTCQSYYIVSCNTAALIGIAPDYSIRDRWWRKK